ncbi:MAG: hypothetical protein H6704_17555 [Myxococcales bacterium]|nr:hypothetical protein [Myxococcales bacterium]
MSPHGFSAPSLALLRSMPGRRVRGVWRILYDTTGALTLPDPPGDAAFSELGTDDGDLELLLDDRLVRFTHAPNCSALCVTDTPWHDDFAPPLSPENEAYVAECGKWTRYDAAAWPRYAELFGQPITAVAGIVTDWPAGAPQVIGARLSTPDRSFWLMTRSDEVYVEWQRPKDGREVALCDLDVHAT